MANLKNTICGWVDIRQEVFKKASHDIIIPLTHVLELSLCNGTVPDETKIACVLPIFKGGDKQLFTNYRPVSVLRFFSKTLEKFMFSRVNSFINK